MRVAEFEGHVGEATKAVREVLIFDYFLCARDADLC